jgi:hypothetical protein
MQLVTYIEYSSLLFSSILFSSLLKINGALAKARDTEMCGGTPFENHFYRLSITTFFLLAKHCVSSARNK